MPYLGVVEQQGVFLFVWVVFFFCSANFSLEYFCSKKIQWGITNWMLVHRQLSMRCSRDVIRAAVLQLWLQQLFGQSKTQGECSLPGWKQALSVIFME